MSQEIRKIIHIDMDCFYAAVEIKYNPLFKGRPVAVGGRPEDRSVICTANYEARKYGVKAAVSSYKALKLCPHLILIPPDFQRYNEESIAIHNIFERFTNKIEPLSLDEAFLDVTGSSILKGSASLIAAEIRRLIFSERKLTASAGIAPNKFLAKVASDWNKPNGQYVINPSMIENFIKELPVEKIPGVGKVTAKKMHSLGIKTCNDLQKYRCDDLENIFGIWGVTLYHLCRGVDEREVETSFERKSLTVERTFPKDLKNLNECLRELEEIYDDFLQRFDEHRISNSSEEKQIIKSLVIKLKFYDFISTTVERATSGKFPKIEQYYPLLKEAFNRYQKPVRLMGLGARLKPDTGYNGQMEMEF
ncbi:MAG: DNA polymerase IV [Oligoflexia bacterium]|nr:DNA polymerase IV [Oligoflexia bacterium]